MEIRFVAAGEEESCNQLHNRLFKQNRTVQQWKWSFASGASEPNQIPYVVLVDGGSIVGTQAMIPIRMIDSDGVYWTAKSEGTLIDPAYRGKQLLERMYSMLFDYGRERKYAAVWGFTRAVKALTPVGFVVPAKTRQLFLPFSSRSIDILIGEVMEGRHSSSTDGLKRFAIRSGCALAGSISAAKTALGRRRASGSFQVRTWQTPGEQTGDLCRRFVERWGGCTIYRDTSYLQWRLFSNPYVRSIVRAAFDDDRLLGWIAYTMGDDGIGYVVDLMALDGRPGLPAEEVVRALLLDAVTGTRNMGAAGIRGWNVNDHPFDKLVCRVAKQIGFYLINRGTSVVLYPLDSGTKRSSPANFGSWFVTRIFTEGVLG